MQNLKRFKKKIKKCLKVKNIIIMAINILFENAKNKKKKQQN
jgi:hypothetical protein